MKTNIASLLIVGGLAMAATPAFSDDTKMPANSYDKAAPAKAVPADATGSNVPADNSAKNVRDRADAALTPGDQSSNPADVQITQQLRKAVVSDPNLSVNAQNVKIITIDGVVTLRGPVKNASEKDAIAAKASKIPGVAKVDNQLELAGE